MTDTERVVENARRTWQQLNSAARALEDIMRVVDKQHDNPHLRELYHAAFAKLLDVDERTTRLRDEFSDVELGLTR